jgi:hypothetical protein
LPLVAVGAVGCILVSIFGEHWGSKETLLILFTGLAMAGGLCVPLIYRCPSCDAVPNEEGIPFDPKQCQKCGAALK